jgi:EmrB/QacA subfamily drug resistance transporter
VSSKQDRRTRLLMLYLLCMGVLMVVLDTTIVIVALPSMVSDLRISGTALTWVLNAYMLAYGGFLLLSGRLGDLYGRRRLFLTGVGVFTLSSLACGLARSQALLLIARAGQGLGGAVVTAVALSLILSLFSQPDERPRAIAVYGLICAAGGGIGELLGGFLTRTLSWHGVFLINVPIGVAVYGFCSALLPRDDLSPGQPRQLDVTGALAITSAFTLLIYVLVGRNETDWQSPQSIGLLGIVVLLLLLFFRTETRAREPVIPLRLLRSRNLMAASVLGVLWCAGTYAWFVMCALYLQRVLGYDPFRVGIAFAPATTITAAFSAGLSAKMVNHFGICAPLSTGLLLSAIGLVLFARAPLGGKFVTDVLPGMVLLGLGGGMTSAPLLLGAMNGTDGRESGLVSGIVNTSFMMGGALGVAVLARLADLRTRELQRAGAETLAALNGGYHLAFLAGAFLSATAGVLGAFLLRPESPTATGPAPLSMSNRLHASHVERL